MKNPRVIKAALRMILFVVTLVLFYFYGCRPNPDVGDNSLPPGLKDYYSDYFITGVSVGPRSFANDSSINLIKQHYGSLTAENVMKMGPIHPTLDSFNWQYADQIVQFAKENGMKVRGHALCWHRQAPDWFFEDENGEQVTKEVLLKRLEEHINAVVGRYKEDVYAWDVVNEAISDNKDEVFRKSKFYEIAGEEFIIKAFEYARAADPDALLFYNDYSVVDSAKRQKIYQMLQSYKSKGVPIDGMGIQAHWSIYYPDMKTIQETIDLFAEMGLDVQITELDVSVYPPGGDRREKTEADIDIFTEEMNNRLTAQYDSIFRVLRANRDKISAVTFWNVSDRYSWLDFFPVRGRKNYPLLFDQNYQPKDAYYKVIDFE